MTMPPLADTLALRAALRQDISAKVPRGVRLASASIRHCCRGSAGPSVHLTLWVRPIGPVRGRRCRR